MNEENITEINKSNNKIENVFKNKNFLLIFLGQLVSNIGNTFYSFAVGYWLLELTNNNAAISGIYLGVCGLTFIIVSLFGGVISDRFNKAKIMYLCDYVKGFLIIFATLLILFIDKVNINIIILFVVGILNNIIAAIFTPAGSSLLPLVVKEEQLNQANSYNSILSSAQSIFGAILAGILYALIPSTTIFFIVGGCYICSAISEMFIKYNYMKNENSLTIKTMLTDIKDGFSYVRKNKFLVGLIVTAIFFNFFISPIFDNFITYFVKTDIAYNNYLFNEFLSPELWGSIFSICIGVSTIIFSFIISTMKPKEKFFKSLMFWFFASSIILLLIAILYCIFVQNTNNLNTFIILLTILLFMLGGSITFVNIPVNTLVQIRTDKNNLGKVVAITQIGCQGLIPIAVFLGGYIIEYWGCSALLFICAGGFFITYIYGLFNKNLRDC